LKKKIGLTYGYRAENLIDPRSHPVDFPLGADVEHGVVLHGFLGLRHPVIKKDYSDCLLFVSADFPVGLELYMGVWQEVAMVPIKFHPGCHALPFYALRGTPHKQPYGRFRGSPPAG
jgi:hypothetical protein